MLKLEGERVKLRASRLIFFNFRLSRSFVRSKKKQIIRDETIFKSGTLSYRRYRNNIDRLGNIMNNTNNLTCK